MMISSVDSAPNLSIESFSGVTNSVLIQTEDGRRCDSSIQYNRIRDYSKDYINHFHSDRPRSVWKPIILLALAVFVSAWLFSESNRLAVFQFTASDHKFGKPKVENIEWIESLNEFKSKDEDALDENVVENATVGEQYLNSTAAGGDDVLADDDAFDIDESKIRIEEENRHVSATNFTNTSATPTAIVYGANATT